MGSQGPSPTTTTTTSPKADLPQPWIETPLIPSVPLSRIAGCNIFLKLENLQPSGSFKSRGIGNMMLLAASRSSSSSSPSSDRIHFYCSSEGNAGIACATTAATLGLKATIVLPVTTSPVVIDKLLALGAEVIKAGTNWPEADAHLRNVCLGSHDPKVQAIYVPPFDHEDIWDGAATLVDEIAAQLPGILRSSPHEVILDDQGSTIRGGPAIDGIVCNVGGGGLLNGVMEGLERRKPQLLGHDGLPTKVLALETIGADSLNLSVQNGKHSTLCGITSIAKSLGATRVSNRTWEWAEKYAALGGDTSQHGKDKKKLISATVTDGEAALACVRFADDARMLVEVSCGATLAAVYNGDLRKYLGGEDISDAEWRKRNVVLVVCGGNNTNLETLERYREEYAGAFDKISSKTG